MKRMLKSLLFVAMIFLTLTQSISAVSYARQYAESKYPELYNTNKELRKEAVLRHSFLPIYLKNKQYQPTQNKNQNSTKF